MSYDVDRFWFRVSGTQSPGESAIARSIAADDPLVRRFVREFPFGGMKALSEIMEAEQDCAEVRATWAKIEALHAGHPDWLRALRAADSDPLDDWAKSHRARLLADLTELGGRAPSDVTAYDELRELAYIVADLTDQQQKLAASAREDQL